MKSCPGYNHTKCPNCDVDSAYLIQHVKVTKLQVDAQLKHCHTCDFLFLDHPSWLSIAYEDEFYGDTGYVRRNQDMSGFMRLLLLIGDLLARARLTYNAIDIGTGLGMFPRIMRDYGFLFYGSDEYSGMQLIKPFINPPGPAQVKTAFEVVEHVSSFPQFVEAHLDGVNLFVFSTLLRGDGEIPQLDWWYYAFENGQHISFHSKKSLLYSLSRLSISPSSLISANVGLHAIVRIPLWRYSFRATSLLIRFGLSHYVTALLSRLIGRRSLIWQDHLYAVGLNKKPLDLS